MNTFSSVEQVGFVNLDPQYAELQMAGGEFCGNATRSAASQILKGKSGKISIKVSGVREKLQAGVNADGLAWAQMPIYPDLQKITHTKEGFDIVEMEGITHVVVPDIYSYLSPGEIKKRAFRLLQLLELNQSVPASGVIFTQKTPQGFQIRPVVWVREIQTLFYETACGSGTTAVGLVEALKEKKSIEIPVLQPSGLPITISVSFDGKKFEEARVSGPIEVLSDFRTLAINNG